LGFLWIYGPEIGDMDEGVVEGGKDTGYAEDKLSCKWVSVWYLRDFQERKSIEGPTPLHLRYS